MSPVEAEAGGTPVPLQVSARQVLMIDADDTLWENNIYFEHAIARFIELVAHPELTPGEVRAAFDALEAGRVKVHGYGSAAFHDSLVAGFQHLTGGACNEDQALRIAGCAASVQEAELRLLDGVAEVLPKLAARHRLYLVTKGCQAEQTAKLERSGLAQYFERVEILHEKHTGAYLELLSRYRCNPLQTWMIGNSPRSDVNPALQAGMHAVHLPHPSTWVLEKEDLLTPGTGQILLRLTSFRDLLRHFA